MEWHAVKDCIDHLRQTDPGGVDRILGLEMQSHCDPDSSVSICGNVLVFLREPLAAKRLDRSLDAQRRRLHHAGGSTALLDDMHELMRQQSSPGVGARLIPAGGEGDI